MDVTASRRLADKALAFAARTDDLSLPPTLRIGPWRGVGWFRAAIETVVRIHLIVRITPFAQRTDMIFEKFWQAISRLDI
jgi:predicted DNA-binding transcriptional regulator AlpA